MFCCQILRFSGDHDWCGIISPSHWTVLCVGWSLVPSDSGSIGSGRGGNGGGGDNVVACCQVGVGVGISVTLAWLGHFQ